MMPIVGPDAPKKTTQVIGLYMSRRISFLMPLVPIVLFILPMLFFVEVAGVNQTTFKVWTLVGLAGFMAGWWVVVWGYPTKRYQKYREMGYIIEIRHPRIIAFAKGYWKPFTAYIDALREAEEARFAGIMYDLSSLARVDGDQLQGGTVDQRIEREEERLRKLSAPTF